MKVNELIAELSKYDPEARVVLYSHGVCSTEEEDEILGCYETEIYDEDNDKLVERIIELYEY